MISKNIKTISLIALVVVIGLASYGIYNSTFSCGDYSNFVKNKLDELNSQNRCISDSDCELITYDLCNAYGIHKSFDPTEFYSNLEKTRPTSCPIASCIDPSKKYKPSCINNSCSFIEK